MKGNEILSRYVRATRCLYRFHNNQMNVVATLFDLPETPFGPAISAVSKSFCLDK